LNTHRKIARAYAILVGASIAGHALSMVKEIIAANAFGVSKAMDAFYAALTFPNLINSIFLSPFSIIFIPILIRYKTKSLPEANRIISTVSNVIFLVLGTIFLGIATPTEGGAMGATGALIMAIMRKRLSWSLLKQAMETTAKLTTFVVFILVGARVFSLTFYGVDGHRWVEHLLTDLPGGEVGFLIVTNILIFFLAFFLDFFELSFIVVPLLGPVADKLGIDLIWFGVLLAVNMQTSFMHPPFGFALFYLRSVAPASIKTTDIYWGAIPFVCIQIIMVGLVIMFPQMVTFGLDKDVAVDLDKVIIDMPDSGYGVPETPPGISLTPEEGSTAEDDANKAIMDSMKQDAAK